MTDPDLLRAVAASFDAAAASLDSCRILLGRLLDALGPTIGDDLDDLADLDEPRGCAHPDAVEVTTLGDMDPIFLCPDCGEQFA